MNDIGPGDLVECVNDDFVGLFADETPPVKGEIYTIREIRPETALSHGIAFRLYEIKNPPHFPMYAECSFYECHFRPVRTTDISIFTEIAQDVKDGIHRKILEDA
ncbi:hypothetical protein LCGC14_2908770 [marine sediment metagenome]|uniref:Uncharacterized protein n=1 Tax=marine sediment metagenome TaxID=412755 RepID=A0A0F8YE41_9ZZZZ